MAIVGPFGCGKSSLVKLVVDRAKSNNQSMLWFVFVSCWGFDNAAVAQESVLKQIVASLSERVDCFCIKGMPSRYAEALSKTSNYLEFLFKFMGSSDPDTQLRQLSPILKALDSRLVVVVEDTDRRSAGFDSTSIEGLLYRFRDVPGMSFIITAGPEAKIDFLRLCEHTEVLLALDGNLVLKILDRIRKYCREKYPDDIDLAERDALSAGVDRLSAVMYGAVGKTVWEWQLTKLLNTPRKLKATVRRIRDVWDALHGEVDFDELLVATCFRVCTPEVFSFLIRRHEEFRLLNTASEKQENPRLADLKREWEALAGQGIDTDAAGKLLQVLYPASHILFHEKQYQAIKSIQQFRSVHRSVYRDRIFNERRSPEDISDQMVLKKIFDAKKYEAGMTVLAKSLEESEDFFEPFKFFQPHSLQGADLWKLAVQLFAVLRDKYGQSAGRESEAFMMLCIMCHQQFRHSPNFPEMVFEQIDLCIPGHLKLATDIHALLFSYSPLDHLKEMSKKTMASLKRAFVSKDCSVLLAGLDELCPWTLDYFFSMDESPGPRQNLTRDWKNWAWLGPILFEGVNKFPNVFIPQVALAIGTSHSHPDLPSDFLLNEGQLRDLFGSQAKDLMLRLSQPFDVNPKLNQAQYGMDLSLVNQRAQRWLEKN